MASGMLEQLSPLVWPLVVTVLLGLTLWLLLSVEDRPIPYTVTSPKEAEIQRILERPAIKVGR